RLAGLDGGLVTTGHGALISVDAALKMAVDARVIPVVFGAAKEIIAYGTGQRFFTEAQRLAMIARDQGCSFPGCSMPPMLCEAHHIIEWNLGGPTSIDNGTLLCGFHHREFEQMHWTCHMINGTPHWTPPDWIDPQRRPIKNRAHDPS